MTIARITNDEATYLHSDLLGSPVAGTNTAGSRIWKEQYTPYGEKLIGDAANDDLGSFTGHIDDSGTGLTYMQARYYDPVIGRFLSQDPVGFQESGYDRRYFNRYTYAGNNPIINNDPDGEGINFVVGGFIGFGVDLVFQGINVYNGGEFSLSQLAASTGAGILTGGGSAIIAASSAKTIVKAGGTSLLGGVSNAGSTVAANKLINGESTDKKNVVTAFLAGSIGSSIALPKAPSSNSKIANAIVGSIDETTEGVGSIVKNTAADRAKNTAARRAVIGQTTLDSGIETFSKFLNIGLDEAVE